MSSNLPVIIVGGNLVGLSAALILATLKVPTIVIEKHAAISQHPRAIGFTPRTMEIYQRLGIENKNPAPDNFVLRRAFVESLLGKWTDSSSWSDKEAKSAPKPSNDIIPKKEYSASRATGIPQDQLEHILESMALERGADIRRQHKLISICQDQDGVTALVENSLGETQSILGSYLIAADGNRSTVRELLKITRHGRGHMSTVRSVLFRAPIEKWTKGVMQFEIDNPDLKAFLASYNDGRYVLIFHDDIERDNDALRTAIYQAIGTSDIEVEIITTGRWELTALVADTFQSGRVFLAGDAAHTLPPNRGGYGANTGIHDVNNLCWKLSSVLSGQSSIELLDTYDAERRPVALVRHDQIFARADYKIHLTASQPVEKMIDDDAMEFGQIYRSMGIDGADENLPVAMKPDEWMGQPGTNLPHFWILKEGKRVPIVDVLDQCSWTLISASDEWTKIVCEVKSRSSVSLLSVQIGSDVQMAAGNTFQEVMSISHDGACLVRPDGYIAWRAKELSPKAASIFEKALSEVSFRP